MKGDLDHLFLAAPHPPPPPTTTRTTSFPITVGSSVNLPLLDISLLPPLPPLPSSLPPPSSSSFDKLNKKKSILQERELSPETEIEMLLRKSNKKGRGWKEARLTLESRRRKRRKLHSGEREEEREEESGSGSGSGSATEGEGEKGDKDYRG